MSKKFNLQGAKQGAPVCTRDGKPVRILSFDSRHTLNGASYPIVVETCYSDDIGWVLGNRREDGFALPGFGESLVMRDDDWEERLARGEYGPQQEAKQPQNDVDKVVKDMVAELKEAYAKDVEEAGINERLDHIAHMLINVASRVSVIYKYVLPEMKARG